MTIDLEFFQDLVRKGTESNICVFDVHANVGEITDGLFDHIRILLRGRSADWHGLVVSPESEIRHMPLDVVFVYPSLNIYRDMLDFYRNELKGSLAAHDNDLVVALGKSFTGNKNHYILGSY